MDILKKFLVSEINSEEFYKCIINFINSYEVRKGEFEGNEFIILKIDRENFILYPEYDDGKNGIQVPFSLSIYKNELEKAITNYAKQNNIIS